MTYITEWPILARIHVKPYTTIEYGRYGVDVSSFER